MRAIEVLIALALSEVSAMWFFYYVHLRRVFLTAPMSQCVMSSVYCVQLERVRVNHQLIGNGKCVNMMKHGDQCQGQTT